MKDEILKGFVEDFKDGNDLSSMRHDDVFERFVNYCVISKKYPRDFDFEDLCVGGSDDIGLDGVAFVVNGNIILSPEEVDFLIAHNGSLEVSFVFIQSKNTRHFKAEQVGTFIFGLKSFFADKPSIPENESIQNLRLIKDKIYANSIYFDSTPTLELVFATGGVWKSPEPVQGRVDSELRDLKERNLFSSISFNFYDAEKLKSSYRELKRKVVKEVALSKHVALPEISGVRQSFVGSISLVNYMDLITDDDGNLQRSLFYDNVRDFQGDNSVNSEIRKTLENKESQAAMCILNNGITIIAKKVEPIGDKMKLTDFQVVNGCQSSHVIYENRDLLKSNTHLVVKIIETVDQDLAADVIKATNRQTEVKLEAFESLAPFHKDLEEYYKAKSKSVPNPIYYERRSKQYESVSSIKQHQVITLSAQIRSYTATRLSQPQSTHRYFGELLDSYRDRMFRSDDNMDVYYLVALLINRIETAFKRQKLEGWFKKFKYQILYIVYQVLERKRATDRIRFSYENAISTIADLNTAVPLFKQSCAVISAQLKIHDMKPHDAVRSRLFTESLRREINSVNI